MNWTHLIKGSSNHISTLLFIGGFIFDLFILPEAGHLFTVFLGALYLCIVAFAIVLREWIISQNTASKKEQKIFSILTFIIAYFSGASLSFISVYAIRSAAFSVSWPLLVVLLLCVLVNELISSHHFRFTLDVGVLFLATLFFIVFNVPVFLKVQNDTTFFFSSLIAVGVSLVYVYVLRFTSESAEEEVPRIFSLAIGIPMFIGMLYFLNVIPAVPLSLANGGVYHTIVRDEFGEFNATQEVDRRIFANIRVPVYHMQEDTPGVYFFSSVSAPAELTAPISHVWEYYDTTQGKWIELTTIAFTLSGGREDGYRAYSQKENIEEGLWRVTVKVGSKRVVGRMKFYIKKDFNTSIDLVRVRL